MKKSDALRYAIISIIDNTAMIDTFSIIRELFKEYEITVMLEENELNKQEKNNG